MVHRVYWGLPEPAFVNADTVPMLFKLAAISLGRAGLRSATLTLLADARAVARKALVAGEPGTAVAIADADYRTRLPELGARIERELSTYLAGHGIQAGSDEVQAVTLGAIVASGLLPAEVVNVLSRFAEIRNQVVHGVHVSEDDWRMAIEAGVLILRSLQALNAQAPTTR